MPDFVDSDYKKEDGWALLYNLVSEKFEPYKNYIMFYNVFTGTIRNYYYLESTPSGGTFAMWGLSTTNSHALLNNIGYFAAPINITYNAPMALSTNYSTFTQTKGCTRGWNCFDTEITYDPTAYNKRIELSIGTYNKDVTDFVFTGETHSSSEGTIVTTGSTNFAANVLNTVSKGAGITANNWVKSNVGTKDDASKFIKATAAGLGYIASEGVTGLIKAGINKIFGSFIGRYNKPSTSTSRLEFKTNGTINGTGTLTKITPSNVSPLNNMYFPGTLNSGYTYIDHYSDDPAVYLGVWNLNNTPIVQVSNKRFLIGEYQQKYIYDRTVRIKSSSIDVNFNTKLLEKYVDHYEVSTDLYFCKKFKSSESWQQKLLGNNPLGSLAYKDAENEFINFSREEYTNYSKPNYPDNWGSGSE